jgi:superfamily I DNA/RNA helicase
MNFNPQQRDVINAIDGVWVVIAGPGSGKTACMVERHLNMIMKGINTNDILNLTFTSGAATEAAKRVGLLNAEQVFRTFHSYALELVRKERSHIPFKLTDTVIPVRGEEYQLLFDLTNQYPVISSFRTLQGMISEWKRNNIEPKQALEESIGKEYYYALAYEEYERKCREQGWLDFDSLMREAVNLLENNDQVRHRNIKRYLSVDECQDTDVTQFRFLQLLFGGNIVAVGDENQLIYEWRNAQSGNLSNFSQKFAGARTLYLGQNYRSTGRLVDFYKQILPVDNGLASHMMTDNEQGVDPKLVRYSDPDTEIRRVLEQAKQDPENSVIIARTNRILFNVQRLATGKGIKYKNLGKKDFWELNEVKAVLNLAKDVNPNRDAADSLRDVIRDNNLYNRYRNSGDIMNSDPVENISNIVKIAENRNETVGDFLNRVRRMTYGRKSRNEKDLMLATVHQSKGREWNNVYLIGCDQGVMPHKEGEIDEERRIFFVACSRAAKNLQVSWTGNKSEFLNEFEHTDESVERIDATPIHQQQGQPAPQA